MDDPVAVEVAQGLERLAGDLQGERHGRRAVAVQHLQQVPAVDVLHDDERLAVGAHGEVVQHGHVGMAQPDRRLGLAQETVRRLPHRLALRADHLDDADLVQQAVTDLVDGPHPALADLLEDLVLAIDLLVEKDHASARLVHETSVNWETLES